MTTRRYLPLPRSLRLEADASDGKSPKNQCLFKFQVTMMTKIRKWPRMAMMKNTAEVNKWLPEKEAAKESAPRKIMPRKLESL